ncbi:MAG: GNAT family N-acetyltransferase [Gemmatimonadaceae bacterium]
MSDPARRSADWPIAARALAASFVGNPFYEALVAGCAEQDREGRLVEYFLASMDEGEAHGRVHVTDPPDGGAAIWHAPLPAPPAATATKHARLAAALPARGYDSYCAIGASMAAFTSDLIAPNTWYLSILGVNPARQGSGVGTQLVRQMLDELDGLGVPSFLETFTTEAVRWYERLGYRSIGDTVEPTLNRRYWVMRRDATLGTAKPERSGTA